MLGRGTLVLVALDPTRGHEQGGVRPAVVVSDPAAARSQKFPLICVVPVTGTPGRGSLYPPLRAGESGLRKRSYALVDQVRSVDKKRVIRIFGSVSSEEMGRIEEGLRLLLCLG